MDTLLKIGLLFEQLGDFGQAQRAYESALSHNDKNYKIYQHLAWCKFQTGHINEAFSFIGKAERRNRDSVDSLYIRGRCYLLLEKFDEAYECL